MSGAERARSRPLSAWLPTRPYLRRWPPTLAHALAVAVVAKGAALGLTAAALAAGLTEANPAARALFDAVGIYPTGALAAVVLALAFRAYLSIARRGYVRTAYVAAGLLALSSVVDAAWNVHVLGGLGA